MNWKFICVLFFSVRWIELFENHIFNDHLKCKKIVTFFMGKCVSAIALMGMGETSFIAMSGVKSNNLSVHDG